jgi:hypothetical protein
VKKTGKASKDASTDGRTGVVPKNERVENKTIFVD